MHTRPPLISGRHWNMTEGHVISEFPSLYENLRFLACGTINVRAALQGEIFSGENSESGSECEMHATITLAQSGGRLPGILSCPSVSPHPVPAGGLRSRCRAHWCSRWLPTQRDRLALSAEEVALTSAGPGSGGPGFELVLLPSRWSPPPTPQVSASCRFFWNPPLAPGLGSRLFVMLPGPQRVPVVPLATLRGDRQCPNPPAVGAP